MKKSSTLTAIWTSIVLWLSAMGAEAGQDCQKYLDTRAKIGQLIDKYQASIRKIRETAADETLSDAQSFAILTSDTTSNIIGMFSQINKLQVQNEIEFMKECPYVYIDSFTPKAASKQP